MTLYNLLHQDLSDQNKKLIQIHTGAISRIVAEIDAALFRRKNAAEPYSDAAAKDEFLILVALSLRHGIEAKGIAIRLGITVSTVHRWTKGTYIPAQSFVRDSALSSIRELLMCEIARFQINSAAESPRSDKAQREDPKRYNQ